MAPFKLSRLSVKRLTPLLPFECRGVNCDCPKRMNSATMSESKAPCTDNFTTIVVDIETHAFQRRGVRMRLLQLAWELYKANGELIHEMNFYIKPDGWTVTEEAASYHGIKTEKAKQLGMPLKSVLKCFADDIALAGVWVGHGVDGIDLPVMKSELKECGFDQTVEKIDKGMHILCTMKSYTDIVQLPHKDGRPGCKWPKLAELYEYLFAEKLENAHDASADTKATAKCYWRIQEILKKAAQ
jgi:DNA polymerase III epsilon subunit-like protein